MSHRVCLSQVPARSRRSRTHRTATPLCTPLAGKRWPCGGRDIVFKDVIEPLESVSVSITKTDKKEMPEYGSPNEVTPWTGSASCKAASQGLSCG